MLFTSKRTIRVSIFILLIIGLVSHMLASRAATSSVADHSATSVNPQNLPAVADLPHNKVVGEKQKQQISETLANLPLRFEQNVGQANDQSQFFCHNKAYNIGFAARHATISFTSLPGKDDKAQAKTAALQMNFIGSNPASHLAGVEKLETRSNYFTGNNPKNWHTNVANFSSLKYENLYNGVDAIVYGNQQNVEYDFVVAPQVDARVIQLSFEGAKNIRIDEQGDLILETAAGQMRQHKPVAYQLVNGERKVIACNYKLIQAPYSQYAKAQKANQKVANQTSAVGFTVGEYDKTLPLIIDPILDFSTFLGGGNNLLFSGTDIAVDAQENIYIVGQSIPEPPSASDPSQIQTQAMTASAGIFVAKIDSVNKRLVYITTLDSLPTRHDPPFVYGGTAIAIDAMDNVYITGFTNSATFPTTSGAFQTTTRGNTSAFIVKLNPESSGLIYSTFLGGGDNGGPGDSSSCRSVCRTQGFDIAVDDSGNAYVTGQTYTRNFPTTSNSFRPTKSPGDCTVTSNNYVLGCSDAFITKLNPQGTALVYSTYLGGSGDDSGNGIAVDKSGNAYVVGTTRTRDFPIKNALYENFQGGVSDSFLTKLNPEGTALVYSTYLGGAGDDSGVAIDTDSTGNVYLCGNTTSADLPTTANALQKEIYTPVVFKTTDGGASWQSLHKGLASGNTSAIAVGASDSNTVFLRNSAGIFKSIDGGTSWKATFEDNPEFRYMVTFAPSDPSVMLAFTSVRQINDTLVRSTDGGVTWKDIPYPPQNYQFSFLTKAQFDPTKLSTIYLGVYNLNDTPPGNLVLLKTTDGGSSWKTIETGFPVPSYKTLIGINPQNPDILFAQATSIFRTVNGGARWKPISLDTSSVDNIRFALSNPATVYASGRKLFKSTDNGVTWSLIESNLSSFGELLVAPDNSSILYTLSSSKPYKSLDGGKSWNALNIAPQISYVSALAIDSSNPLILYAGTSGGGTDVFVMKLNPDASAILYGTYLGGSNSENSKSITVDDFDNVSVVGATGSLDFPTLNAIQANHVSFNSPAFVTKFNSTGGLLYSTYLGGNGSNSGNGVATDKSGRVYVVGSTQSTIFPQIGSLQPFTGVADVFISRIADVPAAHPAPAVFSVTPDTGKAIEKYPLTIKGGNFLPGAIVSLGNYLAQDVIVVDANTIQLTSPSSSLVGPVRVVVINPDGQVGVLEAGFTYLLTPGILQVRIEGNQLVVYNYIDFPQGYNFDADAVLLVNGKEIKPDFMTSGLLKSKKALKKIQPGQTAQLQVRNGNGLLSNVYTYRRN